MAVAIQPAMPRSTPVPIAAARPHQLKQRMSAKELLVQLKPTNNSTGPVANVRSKRERPCDACRRRKSRCVIAEGAIVCVLCEFHSQECTFVQSPQPRKRKLTGEGKKEDVSKKRSVEVEPRVRNVPGNNSSILSQPLPLININNNVLGETLGLQRSKHGKYLGLTTPFDPTLISLSQFDTRNESNSNFGTLRRVNDHECFIMQSDDITQDYGDDVEALAQIEQVVSPHGPALIDLYFRIVHPSFPIIQKQIFLDRMRNGDRQFSPPLLAGMYILALNWWTHDPNLVTKPKPDVSILDAIASRSLAAAMQRPKLSTIQAGLLLLQRPEADSWSLTTQLVAIGQELGLHLDCSNWSIPLWERGLRRRIAWALYMQDKWSSLIHGRPSHIFGANWAVKPVSEEDFHEENLASESEVERVELEKGLILFGQMIVLTAIMAEIMDTFYTQVAIQDFAKAGKNSTRLILERAKPVQIKLKEWFSKLPTQVKMDNVVDKRVSSTGYLHLAYFATEITLHRRIVQSLSSTNPTDLTDQDPYLSYICRNAAKTRLISAMDFVNRLRPEHLQSFWYFPSKINFTLIGTFGSLLWATAPAAEEAEFYKTRLREYRWTLSVSSKRAEFLGFAVKMLDASRGMLSNLAAKPSVAQTQVSSAGVPDAELSAIPPQSQTTEESPPLTRQQSTSAFSGFESTEGMDVSVTSEQQCDRISHSTPPSSTS